MRLGIITDLHEDALHAGEALRLLERANCDEIACLGDISGFDALHYKYFDSRNASECISMIKGNCKYVVAGNHDLYSIRKTPSNNGFFNFPENWYDLDFSERKNLSNNKIWLFEHQELSALLTKSDKEYVASLPEFIIADIDNTKILLSHSIYPDFTGSMILRPKNHWDFNNHFNFLLSKECSIGFSGHLHPGGFAYATKDDFAFCPFGLDKIKAFPVQYICPCLSSGSTKNGILIADMKNMSIECLKISSLKTKWFFLK